MRNRFAGAIFLAILAVTFASAQDNPIEINLEVYVVGVESNPDGSVTETFRTATEARDGQIVEYRLVTQNVSRQTLPAGIAVVTGPVPQGTRYVAGSATVHPSQLLTEYSADGGQTFDEAPLLGTAGGATRVIPDVDYDAVRWTVLDPIEPGELIMLVYRVSVGNVGVSASRASPRNGCESQSSSTGSTMSCYTDGRLTYRSVCTVNSRTFEITCRSDSY